MTASTDIIPFATGGSANVETQAAYLADPTTTNGFTSGIASSLKFNKVWRQSSFMAAGLASFCVSQGVSVPDDGNLTNLVTEITTALVTLIQANGFPSGTRLVFQQNAAPSGWVKDTSTTGLNDSMLRFTTGTVGQGGSQAFSTWNGLTATGAHTLSVSEIPSHGHTVNDPTHFHAQYANTVLADAGGNAAQGTANSHAYGGNTQAASTGISINANGGGGSHTHPLTNGVAYNDVIVCQKS